MSTFVVSLVRMCMTSGNIKVASYIWQFIELPHVYCHQYERYRWCFFMEKKRKYYRIGSCLLACINLLFSFSYSWSFYLSSLGLFPCRIPVVQCKVKVESMTETRNLCNTLDLSLQCSKGLRCKIHMYQ